MQLKFFPSFERVCLCSFALSMFFFLLTFAWNFVFVSFFLFFFFFLLYSAGLLSIKIRISRLDIVKLVTHKTQICSRKQSDIFSLSIIQFSFATFCNSFILRIAIVEREKDIRLKTTSQQQQYEQKAAAASRSARIYTQAGSLH